MRNVRALSILAWENLPSAPQSFLLALALQLAACGGGGGGSAPAAPTISGFSPAAASIASGTSTTLTATFSNGTGSIAPGGLAATSGVPVNIAPAATTTYTLTVSGAGGSATATTTVTVVPPPQIAAFTASSSQSWSGQPLQLTPTFTGGTARIGTSGPGSSQVSSNAASGAAVTVTPAAATTYTLTVGNALGASVTQDLAVAVETQPASITGFTTPLAQVPFGTPISLAWSLGSVPESLTLNGASVLGQTSAGTTPINRTVYTLVARNPLGPDAVASLQVAARGIDVLAGDGGGFGDLDGQGGAARFSQIRTFMAVDAQGNVFLSDTGNATVRKITPAGLVSTVAGRKGVAGYLDGPAGTALFAYPAGIAVDGAGNLVVADASNAVVRRISAGGAVSTLAGLANTPGSADGLGSAARFSTGLRGLAMDGSGVIYLADGGSHTIRRLLPDGTVSTLAGTAGVQGSADGTGAAARFKSPAGLCLDGNGGLLVVDGGNSTIRRIVLATGDVSTLAGMAGVSGSANGTGSAARFSFPYGITRAEDGWVYVADAGNQRIRRINAATGEVGTFAGSTSGYQDGPLTTALLQEPRVVAAGPGGVLHLLDWNHPCVRSIQAGSIHLLAGVPLFKGAVDGPLRTARFNGPTALTVDGQGALHAADAWYLRRIGGGQVGTLAGNPSGPGTADGTGSAASFNDLSQVSNLAADSQGNLFVPDYASHTVRKVTTAGVVSTLAGSAGIPGATDGAGSLARFSNPAAAVVGLDGSLFIADSGNSVIRKVSAVGTVSLHAGAFGVTAEVDGPAASARFNGVRGLARDSAGSLYVSTNSVIRKIATDGQVSTLAGDPDHWGDSDGTGPAARFFLPSALAVDGAGNVFVLDAGNALIRKVSPAGVVTTVAGTRGTRGILPGGLPGSLWSPQGLAITAQGDLLVSTPAGIWQITAP